MKTAIIVALTMAAASAQEFVPGHFAPFAFQARDRAAEQAERAYERGADALDDRKWDEAIGHFNQAAAAAGYAKADGALYWKAYALAKLARHAEAQAALDTLAKSHPQSRWLNDAKALGVEIAQAAGKPIAPESAADEDIRLMAINSLIHSDPDRAIPLLESMLRNQSSPKLRERALFVLSQSGSPKAREIVVRAAKGQFNPDLQMRAVRSLGLFGGQQNSQILRDLYQSSSDAEIRKQVLRSFMVSGQREPLVAAARSDPDPEMRGEAIRALAMTGASAQLAELYRTESAPQVREQIIQAIGMGGNTQQLLDIAKTEKDSGLRAKAIQALGMRRSPESADALAGIYAGSGDKDVKNAVLQGLFIQGSSKQLIEIAKKEADPEFKRKAVQHLSRMRDKEATEYLMGLLDPGSGR